VTIDAETEVRQVLRSYLDAVALVEPLQTRLWQRSDLTLSQARLLRLLRRRGPQGVAELAQRLGHSMPTQSRLVDRLEERGLVTRHREPGDRRRVTVALTEAGERLAGDQPILAGSPIRRAVEAMPPERRRAIAEALRELVEAVRRVLAEEDGGEPSPAVAAVKER
jgi:DNA-binding MarR family transcriptional regulator